MVGLDLAGGSGPSPHRLFLDVVLNHRLVDFPCCSSLSQLNIGHHEVLFVTVAQHVLQIFLQLQSQQVATGNLLDFYDLQSSLVEIDFDEVSGSIATVQTLNENTWTVLFEDPAQSIDVDLQVEQMLLS